MIVCSPSAPGVTVAGLNVAVARGGNPVATRVTTLVYEPPSGGTVTVICTEPPSLTVNGVCGAVTVYAAVTVSSCEPDVEPVNAVLPEYTA